MNARDTRRRVLAAVAAACEGAFDAAVVHDINPEGDLIYWGPREPVDGQDRCGPLAVVRLDAQLIIALDALTPDARDAAIARVALRLAVRVRARAADRSPAVHASVITGSAALMRS